MTEYICPVCGEPLEEVSYFSKETQKTKLRCSDEIARMEADHKAVVYYPSGKRGYWSFGLKAQPIEVDSGEPSSQSTSTTPRKPTSATAKKPHRTKTRRHRRAHNRQREISL